MKWVLALAFFAAISAAQAQNTKLSLHDGLVLAGYVDEGAYINFTGPNLNVKRGNSKFIVGMMPSLRFKQDDATPRNAFVTPALGFGLTYSYKAAAIQIPLYYNGKTATQNGQWHVGIGLGVRINYFDKKNAG